jgi:hypothetical protein
LQFGSLIEHHKGAPKKAQIYLHTIESSTLKFPLRFGTIKLSGNGSRRQKPQIDERAQSKEEIGKQKNFFVREIDFL